MFNSYKPASIGGEVEGVDVVRGDGHCNDEVATACDLI